MVFTPSCTTACVACCTAQTRRCSALNSDHLAWSQRLQQLTIFRAYNWHSAVQQLNSAAALCRLHLGFLRLLPGQGRRAEVTDRVRQLDQCY